MQLSELLIMNMLTDIFFLQICFEFYISIQRDDPIHQKGELMNGKITEQKRKIIKREGRD